MKKGVADFLKVIAGIALFIMLLVGGFRYLSSGGDPKALESAKHTIFYAIAGMIVIAASYIFLLIVGAITGADVFNFFIFRR